MDIKNVRDEPVILTIVPDNFSFRSWEPLQHAALLPVPGARVTPLDPLVAVSRVDHADFDNVVGSRRTMLEIDLVTKNITPGGIEFQLVVVTEPVKLRAMRLRQNQLRSQLGARDVTDNVLSIPSVLHRSQNTRRLRSRVIKRVRSHEHLRGWLHS
jgi:hypothetical protein